MLYTPEQLGELREEMGLNQPLLVQYGTWVGDALHLDFGTSLVNGRSVLGEVSRAMGVTLSIVLMAAVIEAAGILLVGSLCYWCRRKWAHLLWFLCASWAYPSRHSSLPVPFSMCLQSVLDGSPWPPVRG